jgi:hypothetical protein
MTSALFGLSTPLVTFIKDFRVFATNPPHPIKDKDLSSYKIGLS